MNKLVYSVFKTIAFAMIFVFVFDMVFYLYRVFSLNQRVESIMTSLQKVVMENNYLPEEDYKLYSKLLSAMAEDFNSGTTFTNQGDLDNFIYKMGLNYGVNAQQKVGNAWQDLNALDIRATREVYTGHGFTPQSVNIVHLDMSYPGAYGDIQVVQLRVIVNQPIWGFRSDYGLANSQDMAEGGEYGSTEWGRNLVRQPQHTLVYTYYVPCLHYKSVSQ